MERMEIRIETMKIQEKLSSPEGMEMQDKFFALGMKYALEWHLGETEFSPSQLLEKKGDKNFLDWSIVP